MVCSPIGGKAAATGRGALNDPKIAAPEAATTWTQHACAQVERRVAERAGLWFGPRPRPVAWQSTLSVRQGASSELPRR